MLVALLIARTVMMLCANACWASPYLWIWQGDLRYVKLEVQRSTGLVQVTLVWNASSEEQAPLRRVWEEEL